MKDEWDVKKNEVKKSPALNRLLHEKIVELSQFELTFSALHGRAFELADFDLMKSVRPAEQQLLTFTEFALDLIRIDRQKNHFNETTMKRYQRVIGLLSKALDVDQVKFSELTFTNIELFDNYLIMDQEQARNTAYKHHQVVIKYLKRATLRNLFSSHDNPYNDFNNKQHPTETTVLTPTEITQIEELTFTAANQHLEFYRDAFLFGYYTLLRIGDVTQLSRRNIIDSPEGLVLDMAAQKTKKINRQKIFAMHCLESGPSKPEQLLHKYWRTDNLAFFRRSHQKLNEYVKEVVKLAGINKEVTFHTSRHSGITTLVSMGLAVPFVQKLAQHKSIVTTWYGRAESDSVLA